MRAGPEPAETRDRAAMALGVALVSASLLMTELALTRIFSVTMYYHFAFLAISIALFGLSASGVWVYLRQRSLDAHATRQLVARQSIVYAATTIVALAFLVRLRVGLTYSPANLFLMLSIYLLAAAPFFTGGIVISTAISRLSSSVGLIYGADLVGAAGGCLLLIPLLNRLGAPGVVAAAAMFATIAAALFAPSAARARIAATAAAVAAVPIAAHLAGLAPFDVIDTKGHQGDRILFSKWNSFSRVAVYDRGHGDWSLSPAYKGALPETRFMDIDSAASTPILRFTGRADSAAYLRYELTALAYHLKEATPFSALVIGPGGGRDLISALAFGAARVDGVEINPIIARDVMTGAFRDFSGGLYEHPRVRIAIDDGRSFVRRAPERFDVIQASLVDTWAATAAGAYTLTENSLYTVEAFDDYLDHLTDDGVLTITRWVFDGLRLVSLAQEACARRGWDAASRLAIVRHDRVATFLLKATPFTAAERERLRDVSERLSFDVLYLPGAGARPPRRDPGAGSDRIADYAALINAPDRAAFYASYPLDIRPTTDDRPFFFHTTRIRDQFHTAFGRSMLFGNGLSALLTLMAISAALVALFVIGPLLLARREAPSPGWPRVLAYFAALGAGFMLVEVALLQRFVLLLGHPVYSLTVTLFSLLLGTGVGSLLTRRLEPRALHRRAQWTLMAIAATTVLAALALPWIVEAAMPMPRAVRVLIAAALMIPAGILMGAPLPSGVRLVGASRPALVPWAWGMNGAFSVVGATLAIFVAMTWGFSTTFLVGGLTYFLAFVLLPRP
jgi:spermidine synthase